MKKILYILLAVAITAGCNKMEKEIVGEWNCHIEEIPADIYINFEKKGKFELYQQLSEGRYRLYRGTWFIEDEGQQKISGKYNDGEDWGSDYFFSFINENSMTLKATEGKEAVEYLYVRKSIPAEVKDNCVVEVKSAGLL